MSFSRKHKPQPGVCEKCGKEGDDLSYFQRMNQCRECMCPEYDDEYLDAVREGIICKKTGNLGLEIAEEKLKDYHMTPKERDRWDRKFGHIPPPLDNRPSIYQENDVRRCFTCGIKIEKTQDRHNVDCPTCQMDRKSGDERAYGRIFCHCCEIIFVPRSGSTKFCDDCQSLTKTEKMKIIRGKLSNPIEILEGGNLARAGE